MTLYHSFVSFSLLFFHSFVSFSLFQCMNDTLPFHLCSPLLSSPLSSSPLLSPPLLSYALLCPPLLSSPPPPLSSPPLPGRATLQGRSSLRIERVTAEDHGWYECKILVLEQQYDGFQNVSWVHLTVNGGQRTHTHTHTDTHTQTHTHRHTHTDTHTQTHT